MILYKNRSDSDEVILEKKLTMIDLTKFHLDLVQLDLNDPHSGENRVCYLQNRIIECLLKIGLVCLPVTILTLLSYNIVRQIERPAMG